MEVSFFGEEIQNVLRCVQHGKGSWDEWDGWEEKFSKGGKYH